MQSGKDLEQLSDRIRFLAEWNPLDYHKRRWKMMRWLALVPAIRKGFGSRIVHITFQ